MPVPLITRIKSIFARDKDKFWWDHFEDYELSLAKMTISELANELNRTKVRYETANTTVVEHMIAGRLARMQSRASWWSGWLGFAGAMLAAALTFYLGQLSASPNNTPKVECTAANKAEMRAVEKPIQPIVPTVKENAPIPKAIDSHQSNRGDQQRNAPTKP